MGTKARPTETKEKPKTGKSKPAVGERSRHKKGTNDQRKSSLKKKTIETRTQKW